MNITKSHFHFPSEYKFFVRHGNVFNVKVRGLVVRLFISGAYGREFDSRLHVVLFSKTLYFSLRQSPMLTKTSCTSNSMNHQGHKYVMLNLSENYIKDTYDSGILSQFFNFPSKLFHLLEQLESTSS